MALPDASTGGLPPLLIGGGCNGGGAALDVLEVAGVAEKVAVERIAAVTLLVVQLHVAFLSTGQKRSSQKYVYCLSSSALRPKKQTNNRL